MIQEETKKDQKQHVRRLLDEMLRLDGWGEKDREQNDRKLEELHACILDQATEQQLQKLPKRMCAYEFKPGDIAWNCKVCQVDETCVMCNDCFIASDHENHEVFFYYTHSGGCCDCGDTEAWAPEGFCLHHKGAQDVNPLFYLSPQLLQNSRESLSEILRFVFDTIMEARALSFIEEENVEQARQKLSASLPDARFSIIVHYNELQTSQEFASCLAKAHPAIAHQVLKIVAEMSSQKHSVVRIKATSEEAIELAEALYRNGVIVSIVSHEYKSKIPLVTALLTWLASLANLSDGLCRLLCEQFIYPSNSSAIENKMEIEEDEYDVHSQDLILRCLILADAFLPKTSSDALHSLLMALLADPIFKRTFAITFTSCYQQLYREFVQGIGSSSVTILAFGVQFFNRASFVTLLVEEYDLLHVLMNSVLETLRKVHKGICGIPFEGWEMIHQQISSGSEGRAHLNVWDLFAIDIQRQDLEIVGDKRDLSAIEAEAMNSIVGNRFISLHPWRDSNFFHLAQETQLPGRFELDVSSPVFLYRRYMSGLLDLRYALQIEGVSEAFILAQDGQRFTEFLLFLSALQGVCAETRRLGDHVEMESRGWVVAVEFVSTASDVFTWILTNMIKNLKSTHRDQDLMTVRRVIYAIARPIMDAYYFWLASCGKYFAPKGFHVGKTLQTDHVETHVSCHFPIHRLLVQLVRTLCDCPNGLEIFYEMIHSSEDEIHDGIGQKDCLWLHTTKTPLGFWHRVQLIEPALQAIVWDAQVHSGMWVRNGLSVINHSMNYGEPPFCLRFRDLDLMLVQFGFQLLGIQWMMTSIADRFGVSGWFEENVCKDNELMVTECLTLICQLANELPSKYVSTSTNPLKLLLPYLRRQIVQRLCVGPCAHSDLSKIASEFFAAHENLFSSNFSSGPILDQILQEICIGVGGNESYFGVAGGIGSGTGASDVSTTTVGGGKFLYRLKPELLSEYCPTFIHLTRKQHEAAHENWFQERLRRSRVKEQQQDEEDGSSWLDFPMAKSFLPCASGFESSRLAILHKEPRQLVYKALYKAKTDAQYNLTILSRAVTLFTLQVYLVEEIRYLETTNPLTSLSTANERSNREQSNQLVKEFLEWTLAAVPTNECFRESPLMILLKLNPWNLKKTCTRDQDPTTCQPTRMNVGSSDSTAVGTLDGDQKHETGRGIDWLVHRLCRLSPKCKEVMEAHRLELQATATVMSKEDEDRRTTMAQRKKDAQIRAIAAMQQRQAAFAEQMRKMMMAEGTPDDEFSGDQVTTGGGSHGQISSTNNTSSGTTTILTANGLEEMEDIESKPPHLLGLEGSLDDTADAPECAMCHSDSFENSFMCFIGFAQSSAVMSRLNNGSYGPYFSTPMDEMHPGEEVPVHLRMCGHAVHQSCWKSYHASQFQRAITGGHHRHALNAVDVTKGEFLCPLCKSISNVLIPYTTHEMDNVSLSTQQTGELFAPSQRLKRHRSSSDSSSSDSKLRHQQQDFCSDLMNWIHDIGIQAVDARRIATEHQHHPSPPHPPHPPNQPPPATPLSVSQSSIVSDPSGSNLDTEIPVSQLEEKFGLGSVVLDEKTKWLEDGLGSLCMAIHKVACGATERSRPERYTRSASNALFHTLICTFLTPTFMTVMPTTSGVLSIPSSSPTTSSMIPSSSDHLQAELRFLKAMKFIPLLLDKVVKKSTRQKLLKLSYNNTLEWNAEIKSLLHFGGSEITEEGTIVLEEEHPSTQTQTRKQSLWGKVRWPKKPLLLTHLGGVLSQALLLAPNEVDAVHSARLIVLARLIQTLVWTLLSRQHDFAHGIHQREYRKEEVAFFIQVFFDEPSHTTVEHAAEQVWALSERLFAELNGIEWTTDDQEGSVKDVLGKKQLLNLVACEVVPMVKVASFLLYSLYSTDAAGNGLAKPTQLSIDQVNRIGFIKLDAFTSGNGTSPREMGTSGGILSIQQGLFVLVSRWIKRFKTGYEEMNDPQGLLHQWLTGVNIGNGFKLTFPIILLRDLNTVHRSLSALCAGFSRTSYLRSLPRAYVKFYAHLAKRKCESCHQFPSRPAVCLLCGMLLCAANTCPSIQQDKGYPEEANPGACTIHAKKCGRGVGMFLLVLEGAVLLVYWKLAAYVGSLYVDEYGEEFGERNRDLSKGRPLYLQEERRERLMRLWLRHEIPNEVVKIQNSSDRVIRNSHY